MNAGDKTPVPGFRLDPKTGRVVREQRRLDVSARAILVTMWAALLPVALIMAVSL